MAGSLLGIESESFMPLTIERNDRNMKIAVFFPGIGYHCEKPLLYYSGKIAGQYQYEQVRVSYTGLRRLCAEEFEEALEETLQEALAQTESCLKDVDWSRYEDILFISKSIGTAVAAAYAVRHGICCRNVYYTPLAQTFDYAPQTGIVFHGTDDPWAKTERIREKCAENNLPLHIVGNGNHSLEIQEDTMGNLSILTDIMQHTEDYIADVVQYRQLDADEICPRLFGQFIRRQKVTMCRRREAGKWVIREDPFIDDWSEEDYRILVSCLKNTVNTGGFVYAAFYKDALKGFVSVESALFGGDNRYLDLSSIHVSEDMRGRKIGQHLFKAAAEWAGQKGARKLYISSHSAVETQAFYQAMGCVEAQEYHQEHVEREPYDCQLEYQL